MLSGPGLPFGCGSYSGKVCFALVLSKIFWWPSGPTFSWCIRNIKPHRQFQALNCGSDNMVGVVGRGRLYNVNRNSLSAAITASLGTRTTNTAFWEDLIGCLSPVAVPSEHGEKCADCGSVLPLNWGKSPKDVLSWCFSTLGVI